MSFLCTQTRADFSDDGSVGKYSNTGKLLSKVHHLPFLAPENAVMCAQWLSSRPGTDNICALGTSDGALLLCPGTLVRLDKLIPEAHKDSCILAIAWSPDGSALCSGGEDGAVKVWSRGGMLRTLLSQCNAAVSSVAWSPDGKSILYASGGMLFIKGMQAGAKTVQWKAHESTVLSVDWSPVNQRIATCGEDCRFKVWDELGRLVFASQIFSQPVTAVSWSPNGQVFAAGSFGTLRLIDATGWSHSVVDFSGGSVMNIYWSNEGSTLACGGGNGCVLTYAVSDFLTQWKHFDLAVQLKSVELSDHVNGNRETLDVKGHVIKYSLGFSKIILITDQQCYVYSLYSLNTPVIIDLSKHGHVCALVQSVNHFALVDTTQGVQIYSYEGRLISSPKSPHIRSEQLTLALISLSADMVTIRDTDDNCAYLSFDLASGRLQGESFTHTNSITQIGLTQSGPASSRFIAFTDKNNDMFLAPLLVTATTTTASTNPGTLKAKATVSSYSPHIRKLASVVDSFAWNENNHTLIAIEDGQPKIWYYPATAFVDASVLDSTCAQLTVSLMEKSKDFLSLRGSHISMFHDLSCWARRSNGSKFHVSGFSPHPLVLLELAKAKKFEEAVKICRLLKDKRMWACMAAISMHFNELNTAEVAYAAIDDVKKVEYVCHVKQISTVEGRNAAIAAFRNRTSMKISRDSVTVE